MYSRPELVLLVPPVTALHCSDCFLFHRTTATVQGGATTVGMFDTFVSVVQKENIGALWRGTSPVSLATLAPHTWHLTCTCTCRWAKCLVTQHNIVHAVGGVLCNVRGWCVIRSLHLFGICIHVYIVVDACHAPGFCPVLIHYMHVLLS